MSFFDGFVSGAAESASGIIGQQMRDDSELKKQQAFAQFQADLAERKAITLQKLQEELNIRAEGRGLDNRTKERQMVVDEGIANAPRLRDAQIEDFKAKKRAEYSPEMQDMELGADKRKRDAERGDRDANADSDLSYIQRKADASVGTEAKNLSGAHADYYRSARSATMGGIEARKNAELAQRAIVNAFGGELKSAEKMMEQAMSPEDKAAGQNAVNKVQQKLSSVGILTNQGMPVHQAIATIVGLETGSTKVVEKDGKPYMATGDGGVVPVPESMLPFLKQQKTTAEPGLKLVVDPKSSMGQGEMNLQNAASRAGYTPKFGADGKWYYSRIVNGQGENLTSKELADRLNLIY